MEFPREITKKLFQCWNKPEFPKYVFEFRDTSGCCINFVFINIYRKVLKYNYIVKLSQIIRMKLYSFKLEANDLVMLKKINT